MPPHTSALAILEIPVRSYDGRTAPAQAAAVIDPRGVLRDLSGWMARLAEAVESLPDAIGGSAASTLRRGAASYTTLVGA